MRLVFYPDPILLRPAPLIAAIAEVREQAAEMVPLMQLEGGIGLAAPQVGWAVSSSPARTGTQRRPGCW